ncbi:hypothetical protein [Pseudomonas sp. NFX98]|uniref:hypothetical protein n=1 Tax=Pseudomonas sp. NFX98 TaxID=3399122 RepID=UPI0039FC535A
MRIVLAPQRRDDLLEVVKSGDSLNINGETYDFSPMGEGDSLPLSAINSGWFAGPVERVDGQLTVTLFLPNPFNFSPEQAFPVPLVNVPDGPVVFPGPLPEFAAEMEAEEGE